MAICPLTIEVEISNPDVSGAEFWLDVTVTSPGYAASWDDPGDGPDWKIDKVSRVADDAESEDGDPTTLEALCEELAMTSEQVDALILEEAQAAIEAALEPDDYYTTPGGYRL